MSKSRSALIAVAVALAAALPAPSAQGSELAKLGRLIVTGKRAPAVEPKVAPAVAQRESSTGAERGKQEALISVPQRAMDGAAESADEVLVSEPGLGARPSPDAVRSDRVGRAPQPPVHS